MTQPSDRELPFDVAPEVRSLAGRQELRLLARMAAVGPFECIMCGQEGTASKATTAAVMIRAPKPVQGDTATSPPQTRDLLLLRLAHRSCLPSQVIDSDEAMEAGVASINVSTAVQIVRGVPQPLLLLDFVSGVAARVGPEERVDLIVSSLLEADWTLVRDLVVRAPGWRKAVKSQAEIMVLVGSGLGLNAGTDGLAEAIRAGRVAGARILVSSN